MPFATYHAWRVNLAKLIEGDDLDATFSTDTLDAIVEMAEARVHRELRASSMLADLSEAVTANAVDLPDDLLELHQIYFAGKAPVEVVPLDKFQALDGPCPTGGNAIVAAQKGDTLVFWPEASGTLLGTYYARPEPLQSGLHTTFLRYPEVYTYAALVEALAFLGMEDREDRLERRYQMKLQAAQQVERMRAYSGSRLRMRAG